MNLNFSDEELQFQQEVRSFLAENLPRHIVEGTANNGSVFVEKDIALE
jgi:acyl-CoA dehydrogenase